MQVGTDAVELSRFIRSVGRNGGRLRERLFSPEEILRAGSDEDLAVMFSAKEAVSKALGTGFDHELSWHDINVFLEGNGIEVELSGRALDLAKGRKVLVSSSTAGNRTITLALLSERG